MDDATFFKILTDNNIRYDIKFMVYFNGWDNPNLTFKDMQIMIIRHIPHLYYNINNGVYQKMTSDIDEIKQIWNTKVEEYIQKLKNLELLQNKI